MEERNRKIDNENRSNELEKEVERKLKESERKKKAVLIGALLLIISLMLGTVGFTSYGLRNSGKPGGFIHGPTTLFEAISVTIMTVGFIGFFISFWLNSYLFEKEIREKEKWYYGHTIFLSLGGIFLGVSLTFIVWNAYLVEMFFNLIYILMGISIVCFFISFIIAVVKKIPYHGKYDPDRKPQVKINFKKLNKKLKKER